MEETNKVVITANLDVAVKKPDELPDGVRIRAAISLLIEALKIAGMDIKGFAIIENGEDKVVEIKLPWGSEYANITMDNARTAIWDVLKQIPELRE